MAVGGVVGAGPVELPVAQDQGLDPLGPERFLLVADQRLDRLAKGAGRVVEWAAPSSSLTQSPSGA